MAKNSYKSAVQQVSKLLDQMWSQWDAIDQKVIDVSKSTAKLGGKDVLKDLSKISKEIENIDKNILNAAKNSRKLAETDFSSSSPKDLNERLKKNAGYQEQVNAQLREQERLEKALIAAMAKKDLASESTNKQLQLTRFETNQINKKYREQAVLSSKLATEYQKQSVRLIQLKRKQKDLALIYGEDSKAARELQREVVQLDNKLKRVDQAVGDHQRSVGHYGKAWKGVGKIMTAAVAAFGLYSAMDIGRQILNQIKEIDALNKSMMKVVETQEAFTQAQFFLQGVAEQGGLEINELRKSYVKFYASAKTTNLTLKETQDIYESVALAAANLGLSTDDTNGALKALEQMLSKGNVQAEEIRGQLGERLPGAFQILAKSMGLTTEQLNKQLELGNVLADEVLPGFAAELRKTYDIGNEKVETLVAKQNRLNTSWTNFVESLSSSQGVISTTFGGLLGFATKLVNLLEKINSTEFERKEAEAYAAAIKEIQESADRAGDAVKKLDSETVEEYEKRVREAQRKVAEQAVDAYDDEVFKIKEKIRLLKEEKKEIDKRNSQAGVASDSRSVKNAKAIEEQTKRLGYYTGMLNAAISVEGQYAKTKEDTTTVIDENGKTVVKREKEKALAIDNTTKVLQFSVEWFDKVIAQLEEARRKTALGSKEWKEYEERIKKLTELKNRITDIGAIEIDPEMGDIFNAQMIEGGMKNLSKLLGQDMQSLVNEFSSQYEFDYNEFLKWSQKKIEQSGKEKEELKLGLADYMQMASDVIYEVGNLFAAISDAKIQKIDEEMARREENYEKALADEKLSERQRKILEDQREKDRDKLQEKKDKEKEKQAKINKAFALFDIAINTTAAIMKTYAQFGFPAGIPLAIAQGAIGALQLATVAAKPIPKYKEGRKGGKEELAYTGDGGKHEVITDKDLKPKFISPKTATLTPLAEGDHVFKDMKSYFDEISLNDLNRAAIMTSLQSQGQRLDQKETQDNLNQEILKAILDGNNRKNTPPPPPDYGQLAREFAKEMNLNRRANV